MRGVIVLLFAATLKSVICVDVWWESAVVYQIYPRSFMDTTGDGIGDLNGIKSKLAYLKDTGVDAIWLSPIYKSPMKDFGYDITDFKSISEDYGTMDDFTALMTEATKIGIKVILDYVPNHTSSESDWFKKSVAQEGDYTDYFVWANGKVDPEDSTKTLPPSNWVSQFRKTAWQYDTTRQQYYLHQFVIGQPDLNYRNAKVQEEMKEVLRFWLNLKVSGFRMDAVNYLYEVDPAKHNGEYPDEPQSNIAGLGPDDYEYLTHTYTRDQDETYDLIYDWRAVLDEFTTKHNESKILLTEAYAELSKTMRYYGTDTRAGSIPFNFIFLGEMTSSSTAPEMKTIVDKWMTYLPDGKVANWVNGNHDQNRMATRYGVNRVDAMNMLALILPGVSITYQGEEIGMTNGFISWGDTKDPQGCNTDDPINYWKKSRDPARTPYQWDNTTNAGFSTSKSTWLPVASNYKTVNLANQMAATKSHYKFYKDVVALKHTPAVKSGALSVDALSDNILVVTRALGDSTVVGIINLSDASANVNLNSIEGMPQNFAVEASGVACETDKGAQVGRSSVPVSGYCALVLKSVADTDTTAGTGTTPGTGTTSGTGATPGTGTTSGTGATPGTGTAASTPTTAAPGSANRFLASSTLYAVFILIFGYLQ